MSENKGSSELSSRLSTEAMDDRQIMLFDLSIRGHHPYYIQQLIRYWHTHHLPGRLVVVVSPKFLEEHGDVVQQALKQAPDTVQFMAITPGEEAALKSRKSFASRTMRAFQELALLGKYAVATQATHCLIMYFDVYQLPLALGYPLPCSLSGIYFRPSFHYGEFGHQRLSWKEHLQQWREKITLARVLSHPRCQTLFCLDPFAVEYLQNWGQQPMVHLPDPVSLAEPTITQSQTLKGDLGIEPGRRVLLLFGALTGRKGIGQLLDAVALLPPAQAQQLCLLLVGEIQPGEQALVEEKIAALRASLPVQIITHYQFVPDTSVQGYFQLADVVLAPYQRHVGMSGILLQAAAAQKPVLSSDYGLMGELVRQHHLGLTLDSTKPAKIAEALSRCLTEDLATLGDRQKMGRWVEQHAADHYAATIFQYLN